MPYKIYLVKGEVVFPAGGSSWKFAHWHDATDRIEDFKKGAVGRALREQVRVHVELALIHRPDNDYNPNAISVTAPTVTAETVTKGSLATYMKES